MDKWSSKRVADWPDGLILFDGVCVLCSYWVAQVIRRNSARRFSFVAIQTPYGRKLAEAAGIDPENPQTNAVALDGAALFKSDAALAVLGALKGFGWTRMLRFAPKAVRDWLYDRIAKNRYALFGRQDSCFVPAAQDRARFLDGSIPPAPEPAE